MDPGNQPVALMDITNDTLNLGASAAVGLTTAGVVPVNEVQTVTLGGGASAGTFTLTFSGQTTAAIAYDAANGVVEAALEALTNITAVTVTGTGTEADPWVVTFVNPAKSVPQMTSDSSGLVGNLGDCTAPNAIADALPSHFLNFDSDDDGEDDTILVAAGTPIQLVAHVRASADDKVGNGTDIQFAAGDSTTAFFTSWSCVADGDGELDSTCTAADDDGLLFDGDDAEIVTAQTLSDNDGAADGLCNAANDTCVNNADAGTSDGIAVAVITSDVGEATTVTVSSPQGSDTIDIIWSGDQATVTVETFNDEDFAVDAATNAQSVIAQDPAGTDADGDDDVLVLTTVADSAGNPVPGENVQCELDDEDQADLSSATATEVSAGTYTVTLDSDNGNVKGDVTVTCWVDKGGAKDELDETDEITHSDSATVRIAGAPDAVTFQDADGDAVNSLKVDAFDTVDFSAVVDDNTGGTVADLTTCTAQFADPEAVGVLIQGHAHTHDGEIPLTVASAGAGGLIIVVQCEDATGSLPIQVNAAGLPTPVTPGATVEPTITPGGPTLTPVPPTPTATSEVTPEPTVTAPPPPPCGDANGDGAVNSVDAALALQFAAGLIDELPVGDVNDDGVVNSIDAALILQLAAGLIDELPGGETC